MTEDDGHTYITRYLLKLHDKLTRKIKSEKDEETCKKQKRVYFILIIQTLKLSKYILLITLLENQ